MSSTNELSQTSESQKFYQQPYVKKTLVGAVTLISIAAIGCASYYYREHLPVSPLANRMGWANLNNAKAALITAGKATAIAIAGIGSVFASADLLKRLEEKMPMNNLMFTLALLSGQVAGSMVAGYSLGALNTASFVVPACVGFTIGEILDGNNNKDDGLLANKWVYRAIGAASGLPLGSAALYFGFDRVASPIISSISSGFPQAFKAASIHYMASVKLAALAIFCFKVLPSLARFYREDIIKAKSWGFDRYEKSELGSRAWWLKMASFALGCYALFGDWSVDKDLLKKAVAVGIGVSIPVVANNLTRPRLGKIAIS